MNVAISPMLAEVSILRHGIPPSPIYLLAFWAAAFVSLCIATAGMSLFIQVIESDSEFMSTRKEIALAAVVSAIEGAGVWALAAFVPAALGRGIFLPLIVAGLIYQVAHYNSWGAYEAVMLFILQIVIVVAAVALIVGRFQLAVMVIGGCVLFLTVFAWIVRSMWPSD